MLESMEEIDARHRKELKALEGAKRAALKKAKGTKGKKAKEDVSTLEAEFETKLELMKARQEIELKLAGASALATVGAESSVVDPELTQSSLDDDKQERHRRTEKSRKRREKAREHERERELRIAEEVANAGPAARDIENEALERQLAPLNLCIHEVEADGHCLYRAVAAQCGTGYTDIRRQCADTMMKHEEEFAPFCELSDEIPDFVTYVDRVRSSADWGGHLELRALSLALKRPIVVYSTQSEEPLHIKEQGSDATDPIRLSFHLNSYALGEHYNQVVPRNQDGV